MLCAAMNGWRISSRAFEGARGTQRALAAGLGWAYEEAPCCLGPLHGQFRAMARKCYLWTYRHVSGYHPLDRRGLDALDRPAISIGARSQRCCRRSVGASRRGDIPLSAIMRLHYMGVGLQRLHRSAVPGRLGGWTSSPTVPPDGSGGTWQGSGSLQPPPSPLPGNVLSGAADMAVRSAKGSAVTKLRGEKVPDMKNTWLPTKCTDLFANAPLGRRGADLLGRDLIFRDGTGVRDSNNIDVCATGTASLWTQCCQHYPVVFVCSSFPNLSTKQRITKLIHEAMHVAGQLEDRTTPPLRGRSSES